MRLAGFRALAGEVIALVRDDMAHAVAGIGHVAEIARDDMDRDVRHRLAGRAAGLEAHVAAIGFRVELKVQQALGLIHQQHQCGLFLVGRLEPRFDDSAGGDEDVSGGDGKPVQDRKGQIVRAKPVAHREGEEWGLEPTYVRIERDRSDGFNEIESVWRSPSIIPSSAGF